MGTTEIKAYMRKIGAKGGSATGITKRRGDADYYRSLARRRWGPAKKKH